MKYNDDAQLDTSGVQDTRSGGTGLDGLGGRGVAVGGGGLGLVGVLVYVLFRLNKCGTLFKSHDDTAYVI
jgi:hypothetical protein